MKERLQKLKRLLEELKSDSFGAQYGIADFAEKNTEVDNQLKVLARESAFYQMLLKELEDDQPPSWASDLELKWKLESRVAFGEWCLRRINIVYDTPRSNKIFGYQRKGGDGRILNGEELLEIFESEQ